VQNETREDNEPAQVNGLELEFDEDPAAFDALFQ
jgi:hypothetical protein